MAGIKRLHKELAELQGANIKSIRDVQADEQNIFVWNGLLLPENPPFNKAAFRFEITFPARYPFDAPVIHFKTMIYHPNVDDKGEVCIAITLKDNWKAATKIDKVIQALVDLVNQPDTEHPLRAEIADEFINDREKFMENAEKLSIEIGEPRPEI